jgi:hypothetical protein
VHSALPSLVLVTGTQSFEGRHASQRERWAAAHSAIEP